ncbi:methylated-DNA--[protein]-cysteine S-methyltransferase [Flavobacteriaceae bacterium GSB9]|nr:methylated-DNA--[protein]-cysteine S-methyltransferase [Flavobacteriaceae bacterium GSB9]
MESCTVTSPLGAIKITGDENGITEVSFLDSEMESTFIPTVLKKCVFQLQQYFDGNRKEFDLKLNPKGTEFQKRVWSQLQAIPYGKTTSYLEFSKQLGDAKAIRAVANANSKNPIGIVIPCHRVIGSDGRLTGYAGGLHRKKWLLEHESQSKQQSLF